MELQLQNFRCFKNKEVALPEKGLVLLSAPSGSGKSTILNALLWALYGEIKKPQSFGSRSCSVSVSLSEHYNISVRRQAGPGRLVVLDHKNKDQEYEGEAAQEIINKRVGTPKEFLASSYVIQNLDSSVLTLTPGEQLAFVENLSLDKEAIERERQNLKKHISSLDVQRVEMNTKTNYAQKILEGISELKEPACPFSDVGDEDVQQQSHVVSLVKRQLQSCTEQLMETKEKVQNVRMSLERLEGEKKNLVVSDKVEKSHIRDLEKKRDAAKAFETLAARAEERKKYEDFLDERKQILLPQEELEKLVERKQVLKRAKKNYEAFLSKRKAVEAKLKSVSQEIRKDFPTKCETSITSLSRHLNKKIKLLEDEISLASSELEKLSETKAKVELSKSILECPCCGESLVLVSGILQKSGQTKSDIELKDVLEEIERKKKILLGSKKSLEKAKSFVSKLSDCVITESFPEFTKEEELVELSKKIKENKQEPLPKWVIELEKKTKPLTAEEKENLERGCSVSLKEAQRELDRAKDRFKEQTLVLQKLADVESRITKLSKSLPKNFEEEVKNMEEEREKLEAEFSAAEEKLDSLREMRSCSVEWKAFNEMKVRRDQLLEEIRTFSEELLRVEKKSREALLLKEKSRMASFLAVEKTVNAINYTAKTHLAKLFPDDPISIVLKTSKETKKGKKIQMSTSILYKGHDYDSFWSLSGGERQKACLSFILAINEVVGARFLLLDEALAQLHREVNTDILEYLRDEIASNRLVVVVSHEANRGIFHKVIEI
ncbi:putative ATPase [Lausannevirus]|uniref:Putative ATPase n=1 Tax=Lausannevirus TaxID=999883 RepID=F2WL65_9VIRU|nr:putative ATPase [Lausannevirus]AEA06988.1 putative ATPase [Lausannevirus]